MQLRIRLYVTMAVIVGSILGAAGAGYAEWTEPVCLTELNDFGATLVAAEASLSADQLIICFIRDGYLWEAWRQDPHGSFTDERVVSELGSGPTTIRDSWISMETAFPSYGWRTRLFLKFTSMA